MATPTVRPATLDDVEFLGHVLYSTHLQADGDESGTEETWAERARHDAREQVLGMVRDSVTYVIEVGSDHRVGRLRVVRTGERLEIAGMQILPESQRKGIGTAVITALLREAREREVPCVLQVSKTNPDAERLYRRLGFRRSGKEDAHDYWMTTG